MSIGTLKINYPHAKMAEVVESDARFKVICAGRRCGKTETAKYLMSKQMVKFGGTVTYVCPTYKMADEIWNFYSTALKPLATKHGSISAQNKIIRLPNGGTFKMLSADNIGDGFRGFSNDLIVIDEAAIIPNLASMFFTSAMPTLADRKGKALIISTPRGRNDFYDLWKMGAEEFKQYEEYARFKDYKSWRFRTSDNPYIDPSEIDMAKATMPERYFLQEYMGEFLLDGGEFFRKIEDASTITPKEPYKGNFVFGIDFGKKNDYTVICIIDVDDNCQVAYYRFNRIDWIWQREKIRDIYNDWKPYTILAEENNAGDANIEILEEWGLPVERFTTGKRNKPRIIENLSVDIENKDLLLINDSLQISELQSYQLTITSSGHYQFNAASGHHDDTVMALALANEARREHDSFTGMAIPNLWRKGA
jgi:phage FluMu gp28-like protein